MMTLLIFWFAFGFASWLIYLFRWYIQYKNWGATWQHLLWGLGVCLIFGPISFYEAVTEKDLF